MEYDGFGIWKGEEIFFSKNLFWSRGVEGTIFNSMSLYLYVQTR